jgi:small subunit ribosomal protein S23
MSHGGMSRAQAYDIARKEFYALRQEEEVERRVAKDEALWVGAYFGKSVLEVGAELEDKTYESWKAWATKEVEAIERQRDAAYTGVGTDNEDDGSSESVDVEEETASV